MSIPIFMVLNLLFCYVSPEIVIFHELLIVETGNKCHWLWHASNPKYVLVKQFWSIFASQNEQNVKFLSEIVIFQEPLIAETQNLQQWNWHALNLKYVPLKPFWCIFPSQNQENVKCWLFPELPLTKNWKKTHQFVWGKSVCKGFQICTYGFLGMPIVMHYVRTLCDKYFLSYYGSSAFLWEGQDIGFWNMV